MRTPMPQSLYRCLPRKAWFGHGPSSIFFEVVRSALRGLPATFAVGSGHERVVALLLLILSFGETVGGAFAGVLVPPRLAVGAVEDGSNRLLS